MVIPEWVGLPPWMGGSTHAEGRMSQRGLALTTPALSYIGHFLEAKANSWFAPF